MLHHNPDGFVRPLWIGAQALEFDGGEPLAGVLCWFAQRLRTRHAPHQGRWRSGRRFRFSRAGAGRLGLGEFSLAAGARMDAVFIAVIASSITPSNSDRPCRVWTEQVKTAGSFSNHAEMRAVNAAMFACTVAGVALSVLVKTKTKGTAGGTSHSAKSRSIA